jgi:hypothetical protein
VVGVAVGRGGDVGLRFAGEGVATRVARAWTERRCGRGERPLEPPSGVEVEADAGTRTPDPLLTMEVLYRLSYVGAGVSLTGWSGGSRIRTCVGSAARFTAELL